jgi:LEA14-like dessication related protein
MKPQVGLRWALLCALIVLQVACSGTSRSIQPPRVELIGLSVLQPSQRFRVSLLVSNPNAEPVPIEELRFSVRLAGEGRLNGNSSAPLTVAAFGQETLRVDVDADMVSSVSRLISLVQGPQSTLQFEIVGDLTTDRRGRNSFTFTASGQVPLSATADR